MEEELLDGVNRIKDRCVVCQFGSTDNSRTLEIGVDFIVTQEDLNRDYKNQVLAAWLLHPCWNCPIKMEIMMLREKAKDLGYDIEERSGE